MVLACEPKNETVPDTHRGSEKQRAPRGGSGKLPVHPASAVAIGDGGIDQARAAPTSTARSRSIHASGNSVSASASTPARRRAACVCVPARPDDGAFRGGSGKLLVRGVPAVVSAMGWIDQGRAMAFRVSQT